MLRRCVSVCGGVLALWFLHGCVLRLLVAVLCVRVLVASAWVHCHPFLLVCVRVQGR